MATEEPIPRKKKSKLRHIPNVLSLSRIPLSIAMLFLAKWRVVFVCVYAVAGLTDMSDGFLARRFGWQSDLGSKFDGLADATWIFSMMAVVFLVLRIKFKLYVYIAFAVILAVRIVNLAFTRIKFKQWGALHSSLVRYSGIPLYLIAPYCVWTRKGPSALLLAALCVVFLSVVEETLILAQLEEYDMNTKSIWHLRKQKKSEALRAAPQC